jgi:hypothetical protein
MLFALWICPAPLFSKSGAVPLHLPVFNTLKDKTFGDARVPMKAYLADLGAPARQKNRICVVGYVLEDGTKQAWVHWQRGGRIILWEGATDPESRRDALRLSRRNIDLDKDVVANDSAIGGSTYLVSRKWVNDVLLDCVHFGQRYSVKLPFKEK